MSFGMPRKTPFSASILYGLLSGLTSYQQAREQARREEQSEQQRLRREFKNNYLTDQALHNQQVNQQLNFIRDRRDSDPQNRPYWMQQETRLLGAPRELAGPVQPGQTAVRPALPMFADAPAPGPSPEEIRQKLLLEENERQRQLAATERQKDRKWEQDKLFRDAVQQQYEQLLSDTTLSPDDAWTRALAMVGDLFGRQVNLTPVQRSLMVDQRALAAIPGEFAEASLPQWEREPQAWPSTQRGAEQWNLPRVAGVQTRGQAGIANQIARTRKTEVETEAIPRELELREQALALRLTPEQQASLQALGSRLETIHRLMETAYRALLNPRTDRQGQPTVDLDLVRQEWGGFMDASEELMAQIRQIFGGTAPEEGSVGMQ